MGLTRSLFGGGMQKVTTLRFFSIAASSVRNWLNRFLFSVLFVAFRTSMNWARSGELRATSSQPLQRMRHVHGEAHRQHRKTVSPVPQVLNPLDLVVRVVHEALVEPRQVRRLPHDDVGLLGIGLEAGDGRQQVIVGERVPAHEEVGVEPVEGAEATALAPLRASPQRLLGVGEDVEHARGERRRRATCWCIPGRFRTWDCGSRTRAR